MICHSEGVKKLYSFVTCKCVVERRKFSRKQFKEHILDSGEFEKTNLGHNLQYKSKQLCGCCSSPYYFSELCSDADLIRVATYYVREKCKKEYEENLPIIYS